MVTIIAEIECWLWNISYRLNSLSRRNWCSSINLIDLFASNESHWLAICLNISYSSTKCSFQTEENRISSLKYTIMSILSFCRSWLPTFIQKHIHFREKCKCNQWPNEVHCWWISNEAIFNRIINDTTTEIIEAFQVP